MMRLRTSKLTMITQVTGRAIEAARLHGSSRRMGVAGEMAWVSGLVSGRRVEIGFLLARFVGEVFRFI